MNESGRYFAAIGEDIRFGLEAIRNVGGNVVAQIINTREAKGRYAGFHDFLRKAPIDVANKRTVESLIKAGAFDSFEHPRRGLLSIHKEAVDAVAGIKRQEAHGQFDLFAALGDDAEDSFDTEIPDLPEWNRRDKLAFEREMLGLYVSDHPLRGLEQVLSKRANTQIAALLGEGSPKDGKSVTVAGLLTNVQHRVAKASGNPYALVRIEDLGGEVSTMFTGKTYQAYSSALQADSVVLVSGRVSLRDDGVTIHADGLEEIESADHMQNRPFVIVMPERAATETRITELREILIRHPGQTESRLKLVKTDTASLFSLTPYPVTVTADLYAEVKSLLGAKSIEM